MSLPDRANRSVDAGRPAPGAVIFDMGGLLLDTEPFYLRAWQRAARQLGRKLAEETFRGYSGKSDADAEDALREHFGASFPIDAFRSLWPALWHAEVQERPIAAKTGIGELLEAVRRSGVPTAVATSSPASRTELALRQAGIAEFFSVVVTREAVPRPKPAPDLYLEAARRLGVAPEACVALEDSETGVRAAFAAGMRVIAIPDQREPSQAVRALALAVHESALAAQPTVLELVAPPSSRRRTGE